MKTKKILAGVLTAMLSITSVIGASSVYAADAIEYTTNAGLKFSLTDNDANGTYDEAEFMGVTEAFTSNLLTIPAEVNGCPVTTVHTMSMPGSEVLSISIPDSVTTIGAAAFTNCLNLVSVELPSDLTEIPASCFSGCVNLSSINIPDTIKSIGAFALDHTAIKSLDLPDGLINMGNSSFAGCDSLESVEFGSTISGVPANCFWACQALSEVVLPENISSVGKNAFGSCSKLDTLKIYDEGCTIDENATKGVSELTVYGYTDSTAETFADVNSYEFVPFDEELVVTEPTTTEPVITEPIIIESDVTTTSVTEVSMTVGVATNPDVSTTESNTTTTSATSASVSSEPTTTTVVTDDPDVVDVNRILYGDVNVDKNVTLVDIVLLAKYSCSSTIYPLMNATAEENADCHYDSLINAADTSMVIEYALGTIPLEALGRQDKSELPMYNK